MDAWIPVVSAFIGGLCATVPLLIGIAVQVYIHISEIRQKKKEAKTQLALELMRNNIEIVDESVDNALRDMVIVCDFSLKRWDKKLSIDEMKQQIKAAVFDEKGELHEIRQVDIAAEKIACTLGDEIYSEFKKFDGLTIEYWNLVVNNTSVWDDKGKKEQELYAKVISSAGKLHAMLEDKLLSIRE